MKWRSALASLVLCALAIAGAVPGRAGTIPNNITAQATLNSACATSTGCTQADSSHPGQELCLNITAPAAVIVQVSNITSGNVITLEGTTDGVQYVTPSNFPATVSSAATSQGLITNVAILCARMSTWVSGSALVTITVNMTPASGATSITSPVDGAGNVKVNCITGCGSVNATITGPLDGSGTNVAVAVQNTPNVNVSNFPGVQQVTQSNGASLHANIDALPGWTYYPVPASALCVSAACVAKNGAGIFGGLINLSTSPQSGTCTLYDNASAASGQVLYVEFQIGQGQVINFTSLGFKFTNGLVIQCTANPTGSGLLVLLQ